MERPDSARLFRENRDLSERKIARDGGGQSAVGGNVPTPCDLFATVTNLAVETRATHPRTQQRRQDLSGVLSAERLVWAAWAQLRSSVSSLLWSRTAARVKGGDHGG